jgi:hypothetical protein
VKTIDRLGTFDAIVQDRPPEIIALARRLRLLIAQVHPDVVEVPRTGEGVAAYGWGERKMTESYAYLAPQRGWVNLGFYHGAVLDDPERIIEGTGANIRHVKVRVDGPADDVLVRLLQQAKRERAVALGLEPGA